MPSIDQLSRPPIREAVLAIRTEPVADVDSDLKLLVPNAIDRNYPGRRQQFTVKARVGPLEVDAEVEHKTEHSIIAELRDSADETRTVSVRRDGASLSALRGQYEDWQEFVAEFKDIWAEYRDHNSAKRIVRISTRFINEIDLPYDSGTSLQLEDWLINPPKVPVGMPDKLSRFTIQIEIPCDDSFRALVNTVSAGTTEDGQHLRVIFDIDVTKHVDLGVADGSFDKELRQLREIKNLAFFGSLTSKTVEQYK